MAVAAAVSYAVRVGLVASCVSGVVSGDAAAVCVLPMVLVEGTGAGVLAWSRAGLW